MENKKYKSNKKNGGIIPPVLDERTRYVQINCEHCMECRKQKSRQWQVRLLEDIKTNTNGKFITLTFSNHQLKYIIEGKDTKGKQITEPLKTKGYDLDNEIATIATRRFLERWRKSNTRSIRHWLITELGHKGTENIHIHGILWTDNWNEIHKNWQYGFIWEGYWKNGKRINYVNEQTVNYIIKYVNKIDPKHKTYKPKILTSSGIGNNYINTFNARKNKFNGTETDISYRTRTGHKMVISKYWKDKIYTEEQKEQLWINQLNKPEKYIDGQKINISNGLEDYNQILEVAKQKNTELGYLENDKYHKRKKYELERRKILQEARTLPKTPSAGSIQKGQD